MPRFSRLYERTGFQGKTLWEWMELLVVPLVLAIGGFLFTYIQDRNNNQIAQDNQRQVALQTYFDRMSELMNR